MRRIVLLLLLISFSLVEAQVDPEAIARQVQAVYDSRSSMEIDFVQIMTSGTSGKSLEESGVVALKKPGLMRWEYQKPEDKFYISDGNNTYFYVPADKQVMTMNIDNADQEQTHILFLMGKGDLLRDFDVTIEERINPVHSDSIMLNLLPKAEQDYDYIVLEINPRDFFVERLLSFDPLGSVTEFVFSNFRERSFDDSYFEFSIPQGVEVVRMDEEQ
jgi:outer membrane lipoprotein carrier protein